MDAHEKGEKMNLWVVGGGGGGGGGGGTWTLLKFLRSNN